MPRQPMRSLEEQREIGQAYWANKDLENAQRFNNAVGYEPKIQIKNIES